MNTAVASFLRSHTSVELVGMLKITNDNHTGNEMSCLIIAELETRFESLTPALSEWANDPTTNETQAQVVLRVLGVK